MSIIHPMKLTGLAMLAALAGCSGVSEGPVPVSASADPRLQHLQAAMQIECLNLDQPTGSPEALQIRRNELVTAHMLASDLAYNDYERQLLAFVRSNDLGTSLATQIIAAIGGVSGQADVARAASVGGGVLTGTRDALNRSLLNQTVSVLQTHMRASRAAQYAVIIERLTLPYVNWTACMALSDALAYEQAGTLNAALGAMAASAAAEEQQSEDDARQAVRRISFTRDGLSVAFRTYLRRGEAQRNTAREALTELIASGVIAAPSSGTVAQYLGEFHAGGGTPAERAALLRRIIEKESGSEAGAALQEAFPQQ